MENAFKEIEMIKDAIVKKMSPKKIYLFGSFAKGTATEDSDFDFYIVVKDDADNLTDLTASAYKSIRHLRSKAVDIIIDRESRFENMKNKASIEGDVARTGVLLYG